MKDLFPRRLTLAFLVMLLLTQAIACTACAAQFGDLYYCDGRCFGEHYEYELEIHDWVDGSAYVALYCYRNDEDWDDLYSGDIEEGDLYMQYEGWMERDDLYGDGFAYELFFLDDGEECMLNFYDCDAETEFSDGDQLILRKR